MSKFRNTKSSLVFIIEFIFIYTCYVFPNTTPEFISVHDRPKCIAFVVVVYLCVLPCNFESIQFVYVPIKFKGDLQMAA